MIAVSDENLAVAGLLLEMAFEAEGRVSLGEHALVHRSVRRMAADAAFADRFVFENEWAALGDMALGASVQFGRERETTALDRIPLVRIMAVST